MKKLSLPIFILMFCSVSMAQGTVPFPEDNPLFTVDIPENWTYKFYYEGTYLETVPENESVIYTITALDTDDLLQAVFDIHNEAKIIFDEHDLSGPEEEEINGILFYKYYGFGLTSEYDYFDYKARLFQIDGSNYFMIFYSGDPEDLDYYDYELFELNEFIKKK